MCSGVSRLVSFPLLKSFFATVFPSESLLSYCMLMPANSPYEMQFPNPNGMGGPPPPPQQQQQQVEDPRAFNIAIELNHLMQQNQSGSSIEVVGNYLNQLSLSEDPAEAERRRSQNMTECVAVPSSEHVAEIVGRQGEILLLHSFLLLLLTLFITLIVCNFISLLIASNIITVLIACNFIHYSSHCL